MFAEISCTEILVPGTPRRPLGEIMNLRPVVSALMLWGTVALTLPAMASEFSYCNVPLKLAHSPQTAEMTLHQLQVVTRHGDRTPVSKIPVGTVPWTCEPFAHTLRYLNVSPQSVDQVTVGPFEFPPTCASAQLTTKGRNQQVALGTAMRGKYVDRLGFLPPTLTPSNQSQFLFRSTDYPRTRQSGQAFWTGLYAAPKRIGTPDLTLRIRNLEDMLPNGTACPKWEKVFGRFWTSDLYRDLVKNNLDGVRAVGRKIGTWNVGENPSEKEVSDAFYGTLVASDNLYGRVCHNKKLPVGVSLDEIALTRSVATQLSAGYYTFEPNAARLVIGPFLQQLSHNMVAAAHGDPSPRMALYSGHDATLWALLATLIEGQDNVVQIPYASHMAFELWRDSDGQPWVAIDLNGEYVQIGKCGQLCRLEAFQATIKPFIPVDYSKECQ